MTWYHFMEDSGAREMDVVPPHTHHLCLMVHCIIWVGDDDRLSSQEKWVDLLPCWRHHEHLPYFLSDFGYRHQIVFLDIIDGFRCEEVDELGLLAWSHVKSLHMPQCISPLIPVVGRSQEAFFISASHHTYSSSPICINSSGE